MIPMTDADIQDVRALVAHQKAMHDGRKVIVHRIKKGTDQTGEGVQGSSPSSSSSSTAAGGGGGAPPTTETTSNLTVDDAATVLLRQMAERAETRAREQEERHRRLGIGSGRSLGS